MSRKTRNRSLVPSRLFALAWLSALTCCGCNSERDRQPSVLRLVTTTTTNDSGLVELLLPPFEQQHHVRVEVIATGTGKALKLGELGDVDVLLVHAREAEDAFMAAGHGVRREDVMYNDFQLLGPSDDPAGVRGLTVTAALQKIAASGEPFLSRGDDSGTHKRELELWQRANATARPMWPRYFESGQGMGATLTIANEKLAYVLSDRGTYLNFRKKIELVPLTLESDRLRNSYGVLVTNPAKSPSNSSAGASAKHPATRAQLADKFVDYLISPTAQQIIADYRLDGEPLFVPLHLP